MTRFAWGEAADDPASLNQHVLAILRALREVAGQRVSDLLNRNRGDHPAVKVIRQAFTALKKEASEVCRDPEGARPLVAPAMVPPDEAIAPLDEQQLRRAGWLPAPELLLRLKSDRGEPFYSEARQTRQNDRDPEWTFQMYLVWEDASGPWAELEGHPLTPAWWRVSSAAWHPTTNDETPMATAMGIDENEVPF